MSWQPIETAPKDGTRVLLWLSIGICATYDSFDGQWEDDGQSLNTDFAAPTHWMPLPAPPVAE